MRPVRSRGVARRSVVLYKVRCRSCVDEGEDKRLEAIYRRQIVCARVQEGGNKIKPKRHT